MPRQKQSNPKALKQQQAEGKRLLRKTRRKTGTARKHLQWKLITKEHFEKKSKPDRGTAQKRRSPRRIGSGTRTSNKDKSDGTSDERDIAVGTYKNVSVTDETGSQPLILKDKYDLIKEGKRVAPCLVTDDEKLALGEESLIDTGHAGGVAEKMNIHADVTRYTGFTKGIGGEKEQSGDEKQAAEALLQIKSIEVSSVTNNNNVNRADFHQPHTEKGESSSVHEKSERRGNSGVSARSPAMNASPLIFHASKYQNLDPGNISRSMTVDVVDPVVVDSIHGGKRSGRHVCPFCGHKCAKPSVLTKHLRSHTGERPYPCDPCGFSFKTKSNLYKHCKSHAHAVKVGTKSSLDSPSKGSNGEDDSEETESEDETRQYSGETVYAGSVESTYQRSPSTDKEHPSRSGEVDRIESDDQQNSNTSTVMDKGHSSQTNILPPTQSDDLHPHTAAEPSTTEALNLTNRSPQQSRREPKLTEHSISNLLKGTEQSNKQHPSVPFGIAGYRVNMESKETLPIHSPLVKSPPKPLDPTYQSEMDGKNDQILIPLSNFNIVKTKGQYHLQLPVGNLPAEALASIHGKTPESRDAAGMGTNKIQERIQKIISDNQEIMDNSDLESVKPRKLGFDIRDMGSFVEERSSPKTEVQQPRNPNLQDAGGSDVTQMSSTSGERGTVHGTPQNIIHQNDSGMDIEASSAQSSDMGLLKRKNMMTLAVEPEEGIPFFSKKMKKTLYMPPDDDCRKDFVESPSHPPILNNLLNAPKLGQLKSPSTPNKLMFSSSLQKMALPFAQPVPGEMRPLNLGSPRTAHPERPSLSMMSPQPPANVPVIQHTTKSDTSSFSFFPGPSRGDTYAATNQQGLLQVGRPSESGEEEELDPHAALTRPCTLNLGGIHATNSGYISKSERRRRFPNRFTPTPKSGTSPKGLVSPRDLSSTPGTSTGDVPTIQLGSPRVRSASAKPDSAFRKGIEKFPFQGLNVDVSPLARMVKFPPAGSGGKPIIDPRVLLSPEALSIAESVMKKASPTGAQTPSTPVEQARELGRLVAHAFHNAGGNIESVLSSSAGNIIVGPIATPTSTGAKSQIFILPSPSKTQAPSFPGMSPSTPSKPFTPTGASRPFTPTSASKPFTPTGGPKSFTPTGLPKPFTPTGLPKPFTPTGPPRPFTPTGASMQPLTPTGGPMKPLTPSGPPISFALGFLPSRPLTPGGALNSPVTAGGVKPSTPRGTVPKGYPGMITIAATSTAVRPNTSSGSSQFSTRKSSPRPLPRKALTPTTSYPRAFPPTTSHPKFADPGFPRGAPLSTPNSIPMTFLGRPPNIASPSLGKPMAFPPAQLPLALLKAAHQVGGLTKSAEMRHRLESPVHTDSMKISSATSKLKAVSDLAKVPSAVPSAAGSGMSLASQTKHTPEEGKYSCGFSNTLLTKDKGKVLGIVKNEQGQTLPTVPIFLYANMSARMCGVTKVTHCCSRRLQPMYAAQGSNPKISMYSNWRTARHVQHPLGISWKVHLGMYNSHRNKKKGKVLYSQCNFTPGGIYTESKDYKEEEKKTASPSSKRESGSLQNRLSGPTTSLTGGKESKASELPSVELSHVPLFPGGYESHDDYVYIRGRGRGKYVCGECGIRCKKPSMLKKHIRTHTDLRPYQCKGCSFSFKTKGNLTKHMKSKAHVKKCLEIGVPPGLDLENATDDPMDEDDEMQYADVDSEDTDSIDDEDEEDDDVELSASLFSSVQMSAFHERMGLRRSFSEISLTPVTTKDNHEKDLAREQRLDELIGALNNRTMPPLAKPSRSEVVCKLTQHLTKKQERGFDEGNGTAMRRSMSVSSLPVESSPPTLPETLQMGEQGGEGNASQPLNLSTSRSHPSPRESLFAEGSSSEQKNILTRRFEQRGGRRHGLPRPHVVPIPVDSQKGTESQLTASRPSSLYPPPIIEPISSDDEEGPRTKESSLQETTIVNSFPPACPDKSDAIKNLLLARAPVWPFAMEGVLPSSPYSPRFIPPSPSMINASPSPNLLMLYSPVSGRPPLVSPMSPSRLSQLPPTVLSRVHSPSPLARTSPHSRQDQSSRSEGSSLSSRSECTSFSNSSETPVSTSTNDPSTESERSPHTMEDKSPTLRAGTPGSDYSPDDEQWPVPSSSGPHRCSTCGKGFMKPNQLRIHSREHSQERYYTCFDCSLHFPTKFLLSKHERTEQHFAKVEAVEIVSMGSDPDPRPFKCKECSIAFRIPGHLAKHLRSRGHLMTLERTGKLPPHKEQLLRAELGPDDGEMESPEQAERMDSATEMDEDMEDRKQDN